MVERAREAALLVEMALSDPSGAQLPEGLIGENAD